MGLRALFDAGLSKLIKNNPEVGEVDVPEGAGIVSEFSWMVEANRDLIEIDITEMVKNSPIVSTAIDIVTEHATIFDEPDKRDPIVLHGSEQFKKIIDPFVDKVGLMSLVPDFTSGTLRYGNFFVEICYDDKTKKIGRLKILPSPREIRRNEDDKGVLKNGGAGSANGEAAFEQWKSGSKVASFFPWQMYHFKFGEGEGKKYVTPYLAPITKVWTGYRIMRNQVFGLKAEMGLVIRVHKVPIPFNADADQTKKLIRQYRENFGIHKSYAVTSGDRLRSMTRGKVPNDVFVPMRYSTDGKIVGPEIDIKKQITDIFDHDEMLFWANHLFTRLRVPPKLLFWDTSRSKIAEAGTDPEKGSLVKFSRSLSNIVDDGIRKIIEIELFLNGVLPSEDTFKNFRIETPSSHTTSDLVRARSAALIGQSILMAQQAGVDIRWWLTNVVGMNRDEVESLVIAPPISSGEHMLMPDIDELINHEISSDI